MLKLFSNYNSLWRCGITLSSRSSHGPCIDTTWIFAIYLLYMIIFAPRMLWHILFCYKKRHNCTLKVLCTFETHKQTCRAWAKHNCTPWFYDLISWQERSCKTGLRDVKSDLVCFWKGTSQLSMYGGETALTPTMKDRRMKKMKPEITEVILYKYFKPRVLLTSARNSMKTIKHKCFGAACSGWYLFLGVSSERF